MNNCNADSKANQGNYLVSVIVPLYNGESHIGQLLKSVSDSSYRNVEVIIVDDGSSDSGLEIIRTEFPSAKVLRNGQNRGKSFSLNRGLRISRGSFIIMSDQDLIFHKDLISKWVDALVANPRLGVCGCYVYYKKSRNFLFTAGSRFDKRRGFPRLSLSNVSLTYSEERYEESSDWIFDNVYVVRRSVIESVGAYDHLDFPIVYEEADLQLRASMAGFAKSIVPGARAFHDIPLGRLDQLRRLTKYKAEMLCRNRLILVRKFDFATPPMVLGLLLRSLLFYGFVAVIQPTPVREKTAFLGSVVRGVSRGLLDPLATKNGWDSQSAALPTVL